MRKKSLKTDPEDGIRSRSLPKTDDPKTFTKYLDVNVPGNHVLTNQAPIQ